MLVAAACGAETVPPDRDAAEQRTTSPRTVRVETVMRISFGERNEDEDLRWTEILDYANDRGISVEAETGCRTITIGEVSYWEIARRERMPAGKGWVKSEPEPVESETIPEEREDVTSSANGTMTFSTWSTSVGVAIAEPDPDEYLDYVREHADHLDRVGEDEVRGVRTTRYHATIDLRRVIRLEVEESGSKQMDIDSFVDGVDDSTQEIELWTDAEGLARRVVTTTSSYDPDTRVTARSVTTTEYFDFGVEVEVEPPPADEVVGSEEWLRLTEQRMRAELEEWSERPFSDALDDEASTPSPSCLD